MAVATRRSCRGRPRRSAPALSPSSASTASRATSLCAMPACRTTWSSATCWPRPSPAPTATPWPATTTSCAAHRSSSSNTASGAPSSAERTTTTWCGWTSSASHAVGGLDAEQVQAEAEDVGREVTQRQAVGTLLGGVGPQHRALLVEGGERLRRFEQVGAQPVWLQRVGHGLDGASETEELQG